jgi:aerobic carbon-monoxide dehydrogenase medium subunit
MKPSLFRYERPSSVEAALRLLAENEGARPIAGGQSLGPMLNLRAATPDLVVDISRLAELRRIEDGADAIIVGAGVRHAEFEDGRVPDVLSGLLSRVARGIAYRAVRNRGTIGGSLAHADPAADWPPVLIALAAVIQVRSTRGNRTIAAPDLITGALTTSLEPDELIEEIRIPRFDRGARAGYHKISLKPGDFAESLAVIIANPERSEVRAVLAGNAQPPILMKTTAQAISAAKAKGKCASVIKQAVREDLEAGAVAQPSSYELALHTASIVRATRELWSA